MARDLSFQLFLLQNAPWREMQRRFRLAEDLGFDLAAAADHFVDWRNPTLPWLEGWSALAAAARETTRIRLATFVTQIPFRNPALLARQAQTVDHISDGRLLIGLGTGLTADPAYDMMGLPNWDYPERVARLKEYVEIVDLLLRQETTTYEGRYYRIKGAVMSPPPIQRPRPPIAIAALGPRMLGLAARHADVWNSLSFKSDFPSQLAETRERGRILDDHCAKIGRDPASIARSFVVLDQGSRDAGGGIFYYESEAAFVDMVGRVAETGINEIVLLYPTAPAQMANFERFAREVMPTLRRRR